MIFNDDEEIELLDLDDNKEIIKKIEVNEQNKKDEEDLIENKTSLKHVEKKNKSNSNTKEKHGKKFIFQLIFCSFSAIFILGCCIFYGSRLIKYYRIYNPKGAGGSNITLLSNEITSKSEIVYEGSGLYINGGNYIYKGEVANNYLKYNNMLWRIVRINKDDTIEIISDDYINVLNWHKEINDFNKTDIYKYLNDYFLKKINKDMLITTNICTNQFDKLSDLSCDNKISSDYVSLIDVNTFLNSIVSGKTYLSSPEEIYWLSSRGSEKAWHTNGYNVSMSETDSFYEIRPMVTLKATTALYEGNGTIDSPYLIENKKEVGIGSIIKIGEDLWTVYDNDNNLKLSLNRTLDKQHHFSNNESKYNIDDDGSIANYLNTTYYDSLSYKKLLLEDEWYNGTYKNSYKDILNDKVTAKVGLLNINDLKFNSEITNYLLMTDNNDKLVYTYGEIVKTGKPAIYRNIRPCISISRDITIKSGNGSINDPYQVEVA